nr:MAG TPA: hypothetical protein [Caudoviricetes sp.]
MKTLSNNVNSHIPTKFCILRLYIRFFRPPCQNLPDSQKSDKRRQANKTQKRGQQIIPKNV